VRPFPISLLAFAITGLAFLAQMIPGIGIILMFVAAPLWSIALINAGMAGIAVEALKGQVPRGWLIIPLVFYGGYLAFATADHIALYSLRRSYDAANARVAIPFDSTRQSLVFETAGYGSWYTQNFALPVAYSVNPSFPEGFLSTRMIDRDLCEIVRRSISFRAAGAHIFWFHDGEAIRSRSRETRFCNLSMLEKPKLPQLRITQHEEKQVKWFLPVTQVTTIVTFPDGRRFELLGGTARPFGWIPRPVFGCVVLSGDPGLGCAGGFARGSHVPIVSGDTRYHRDAAVLAHALGLRFTSVARRQASIPDAIRSAIAEVEEFSRINDIADVDAMIADPIGRFGWDITYFEDHPEELAVRSESIVSGLELAAAADEDDRAAARESGLVLARLLVMMPTKEFATLRPRIAAMYEQESGSHWLWEANSLVQRLKIRRMKKDAM
jgi:hypothetical protein